MKTIVGIAMMAAVGFGGTGRADVIALGASKDAMIFGTSAGVDTGNASGKGPALFAGADGSSNRKRSMLAFDVSSIPAGATITSVTMTLTLAQIAGSGGGSSSGGTYPTRTYGLYDLLQDWGEGNSGSPTSSSVGGTGQGYTRVNGDSTWDYAFYNSNPALAVTWDLGGTDLHGGNFSATESAASTFTSFTVGNPYTWSSAGMVADVQAWVNGTTPNDGWLLKSDNLESSPTSFLGFWSKDGAAANNNAAWAPSLTVTYTVGAPEPMSVLLLAGGLPWLLGRRRTNGGNPSEV
jgi:hypothetical protein